MFGEVKSSSKAIRNASPNAKTYVLMGYRSLSDVHIISARNDAALTEMFALRESADAPMRAEVIRDYWLEIRDAVQKCHQTHRSIHLVDYYIKFIKGDRYKMNTVETKLNALIAAYNKLVKGIDDAAAMDQERAYGGIIRAGKGKLVENLAHHLVQIAWVDVLNQNHSRIEINKKKNTDWY